MPQLCIILGGGGHAGVLIDSLQSAPHVRLHGVLDPNRALWGTTLFGIPVLGGDELLAQLVSQGVNCFAVGLGGTGDNRQRQGLFELGLAHHLEPVTVIHATATCSRWATLGAGCQLFPGSIVNAGAELGVNVLVNSGAIVEHDCRIGHHAHVATGAKLAGAVRIGARAHVGAGATVRQRLAIGENAVVGAGAVVVKDVACGQTVVWVPARAFVRQRP